MTSAPLLVQPFTDYGYELMKGVQDFLCVSPEVDWNIRVISNLVAGSF
jgi:hypothetical protein